MKEDPRCDVTLSHALMDAIERAPIAFGGRNHYAKVIDVRGDRLIDPIAANITVQATVDGAAHRLTLHLALGRLDDDEFVVDAVVSGMLEILRGDLPPGTRQLL
jgi:hypothetical protein